MSIRRTLILAILGVVVTIYAVALFLSYRESTQTLSRLFDGQLAQSAHVVEGLIREHVSGEALERLRERLTRPREDVEDKDSAIDNLGILGKGTSEHLDKAMAFQVWTPDGDPLLDSPAALNAPLKETPAYDWIRDQHWRWRTYTLHDSRTGYWIRTAQRGDLRQELATKLALGNTMPLLIALPCLMLVLPGVIWLGFRPLARLERQIQGMAPTQVEPLDESVAPKEVRSLVRALNKLLIRLSEALDRERQFTANAAHELRTPLTALRLNIESQLKQDPERRQALLESVDRMVNLVQQMLLLSRLDPERSVDATPCNLNPLVAEVLAELAPVAMKKDVELTLEESTTTAPAVKGNPVLLATLVRNLVGNAIQYSPPDSTVEVFLCATDAGPTLLIRDYGPGIPPLERQRVMQRFVRLDHRLGQGSGLGLAIVSRIAELHGAEIALDSTDDQQRGLSVTVRFTSAAS